MNIDRIQELVALAGQADILDDENVQTLLTAIGLDDDKELADDAKELFAFKALGKLTSPDPFYPLPVDSVAGDIEFGKIGNTESSFGLQLKEMTQHILLAGRSGSGKTTLLYHMMNQLLEKDISWWCFDFKKEFRGLLRKSDDVLVLRPENFKLNPLRPPEGIPPLRWIAILSDVFSHATSLLEGSNSFLLDQIFNLYELFGVFDGNDRYPSFHELKKILEHTWLPLSSRESRYLEVVKNRIQSCVLNAGDMLNCDRDMFDDLVNQRKSVVFEFYGISEHVTTFLIEILLAKLYFYRMAQGRKASKSNVLIVFMDEARNVYDYRKEMIPESGIPFIDTLTERIRDFGVSLVIASQIPSELCASAKSNTYSKIMMSLGNGRDIADLSACMGLNDDQTRFSYQLDVGQAVVKLAGRYTNPFWIQVPHVKFDKDVSDSEVEKRIDSVLSEFNVVPVIQSEDFEDHISSIRDRGKAKKKVGKLPNIAQDLLLDVFKNPYVPISKRYDSLGLSRKEGKVIKDCLMSNGLAREVNIKVSNNISNYLVLNKKGFALCEKLGYDGSFWREIVSGNLSFHHKFYQNLIRRYLTQDGWEVKLESRIKGNKWVDVDAVHKGNGFRMAIEIAVSKFVPQDIEKCFEDDFDEVRVVCKDEIARKKIENTIFRSNCDFEQDLVFVQTINEFLSNIPKMT
jgi:DNA helicase HerA-like ATPase